VALMIKYIGYNSKKGCSSHIFIWSFNKIGDFKKDWLKKLRGAKVSNESDLS